MQNTTFPSRTRRRGAVVAVAAAVAVAVAATSVPACADEAREQALEGRVADLERLVKQLLAEHQAAPAAAAAPAQAGPAPVQQVSITPNAAPGTRFFASGFIKVDGMYTDTQNGYLPEQSSGRDFYGPAGATMTPSPLPKSGNLNAIAKQSRLIVGTDTPLDGGDKVSTRFEFDLYGTASSDQRTTNAYGVLLRHAFIQWRGWLVGQTWSNFMDATALPETTDYVGTTDGTVFVRQPQVRYSNNGFSFSVENRQTTLTPHGGGTRITSDDGPLPDLTGRYTWSQPWGYLSVGAMLRDLRHRQLSPAIDDSKLTAAGTLSGKINLGRDDIRFALNTGDLGRYVGLNFANDAVIDASGKMRAINGTAGFISYRHFWVGQLRSTFGYSAERYSNTLSLTGGAANKESSSWTANLFYSPFAKLDIGAEYRHATRRIESGASTDLSRLELTGKYSF
jgi:hypothetical protein